MSGAGHHEMRRPIEDPVALAWAGERLLVATLRGDLWLLDGDERRQRLATGLGCCPVLEVHPDGDRYLVVSNAGRWFVGTLDGDPIAVGVHPHRTELSGFFAEDFVVLVGEDHAGVRTVEVYDGGERVLRSELPPFVYVRHDGGNDWVLIRSLQSGLQQLSFDAYTRTGRFEGPEGIEPTGHRLRTVGEHVLGRTPEGVCVWDLATRTPRTMRLSGIRSTDFSARHGRIAMGTVTGAVALARLDDLRGRTRPDMVSAFESSVTCVAISPTQPLFAAGAESLRLFSW